MGAILFEIFTWPVVGKWCDVSICIFEAACFCLALKPVWASNHDISS